MPLSTSADGSGHRGGIKLVDHYLVVDIGA